MLLDWDDASLLVKSFSELLLQITKRFVPLMKCDVMKSTHPWLNDTCRAAIREKCMAAGTLDFDRLARRCSEVLLKELERISCIR